jgi:membrane protease subunit (stomatin/prohibitin family)
LKERSEKNVKAYSDARQDVQGQQVVYAQPQQAAPAPQEDPIAQLERLGALRDQGVLTEEEFQAQKAKILDT